MDVGTRACELQRMAASNRIGAVVLGAVAVLISIVWMIVGAQGHVTVEAGVVLAVMAVLCALLSLLATVLHHTQLSMLAALVGSGST